MRTHIHAFSYKRSSLAIISLIAITCGATIYRYASNRLAAIALVESTGGRVTFLPRPTWLPAWIPIPQWFQPVDDVWLKTPRHFDYREIAALHELRALAVTCDEIDDDQFHLICSFPRVERLLVRSQRLTDEALASTRRCRHLRILELPTAQITDNGLAALKGSRLTRLYFNPQMITDKGLQHLTGLALSSLNLNGSQISDLGLEHLKGMPLADLYLDDTQVSDAGLRSLTSLPLRILSLWNTRVTRRGLANLKALRTLEEVRLSAPPFTKEDEQELREQQVPAIVGTTPL